MESTHVEDSLATGEEPAPLERALAMITNLTTVADPTLADVRSGYERMLAELPVPDGLTVVEESLGGVRCLRIRGVPSPKAAMLMLHGGGYVMGSADGYAGFAGALAQATGIEVVACDYRLAPEHPYPAALDDTRAAFDSLATQYGAHNLVVLGDSAGGGLATGLLMSLRDEGVAPPSCGVVICPELDLTASSDSVERNRDRDPVLRAASIRRNGGRYLGGRDPRATPYASPHFGTGDGLPPLLVLVTDAELFFDEAVA